MHLSAFIRGWVWSIEYGNHGLENFGDVALKVWNSPIDERPGCAGKGEPRMPSIRKALPTPGDSEKEVPSDKTRTPS
jgi:hypothetical protein